MSRSAGLGCQTESKTAPPERKETEHGRGRDRCDVHEISEVFVPLVVIVGHTNVCFKIEQNSLKVDHADGVCRF